MIRDFKQEILMWTVKPILLGAAVAGLFLLTIFVVYDEEAGTKTVHAPVPVPNGHKIKIPPPPWDCTFTEHKVCPEVAADAAGLIWGACYDDGGWRCVQGGLPRAPPLECLCGDELCECPTPLHMSSGIGTRVFETVDAQ